MRQSVRYSHDLKRVIELPRRQLDIAEAERRAAWFTKELALVPGVALRPWQGYALWELCENMGLYLAMAVGGGKTLLSWLMFYVLDALRPVLILPAGLRQKTLDEFREFQGVWRQPNPFPRIISIEELALDSNHDLLYRIGPDVIGGDECDLLSNPDSAAVRRIDRYQVDPTDDGKYPRNELRAMAMMTGTPGRNSTLDYSHHLIWCLGDRAPTPLESSERNMWAAALDEKPKFRAAQRPNLGALEVFGKTLSEARNGYRTRLVETPGVVIVDGDSCDQPLTIRQVLAPEDPIINEAFERFRMTNETPDGWPISDALSVYRHASELGTGMYYKWDPRPPDWWLDPRRVFCKFVREVIEASANASPRHPIITAGIRITQPLDTELQVRKVCREHPFVRAWAAVAKRFEPNSVPVWLSSSVVQYAADWEADSSDPGLIWVGTQAFGNALAAATGLSYYGAEGLDQNGRSISKAPTQRSAILSIAANRRGRNLQGWARNLVVNPPQSARYLEQVIGRTHRAGQERSVEVDLLITSGDILDSFESAWREACFGRSSIGITQKLIRAGYTEASPTFTDENEMRWASRAYLAELKAETAL